MSSGAKILHLLAIDMGHINGAFMNETDDLFSLFMYVYQTP